ncbi:MAG: hypothetical protein M0P71_07330 [Melioribacteraceae bacterium]|jgi:lysophospholipase L1-like esterase|nr:hypothetical protein [Melioribacteraceae bacterium]
MDKLLIILLGVCSYFLIKKVTSSKPENFLLRNNIIVAVGDSHVEPGSALISELQKLMPDFTISALGIRGYTTTRWLNSQAEFKNRISGAGIVLLSIGDNDVAAGKTTQQINANIENLKALLDYDQVFVYINPPRTLSGINLANDGIHLTRSGAQQYAPRIKEKIVHEISNR